MIDNYRSVTPPAGDTCCQPHPAFGPPPSWLRNTTHRERLDLAVATLRYYGVTTVTRCAGDADGAREHIARALHDHYPDGTDSYILWTAADDVAAFTRDGTLVGDLTLHHSPDIAPAVAAVLDAHGLTHRPGRPSLTTTVIAC